MGSIKKWLILSISIICLGTTAMAQEKDRMYRIARIKVDPAQLDKYNAALKIQMTTAIRLEPGVLSYEAVSDKKDPSSITIFEVYADTVAYKAHTETAHFKKYKDTVKDMVKSLELEDVNPVAAAKKPGM